MAKINNQPPKAPLWPWGGPRSVREKLVDPTQFDRKKKLKKTGNPKSPALASAALLDFIGPAHSSEELRLPTPPHRTTRMTRTAPSSRVSGRRAPGRPSKARAGPA